ncbi:hypothetical protein BGX34_008502 [Mortierella sp. NVP85]|nr:hypothetical protein BGX34_008502 [Mortierella sp. NVP85]
MPPMTGSFQVGGMTTLGKPFPSFAAVLNGAPQEDIRICLSTTSSCHVFDFNTYKRGKLHNKYPYMLTFEPFRAGTDTVTIKSAFSSSPMTVHGRAQVPIEVEGHPFEVEAYLVDLPQGIHGFFSRKFLADFNLSLGFTPGGMQKIVFNEPDDDDEDIADWVKNPRSGPPMKGSFQVGGMSIGGGPFPSFAAVLDGNPQEDIRICVSGSSTCNVFDFKAYKRGKLHEEFPHNLNFEPFRPGKDTVTLTVSYTSSPMKVHGRASVPIEIEGCLFQVDAYLTDLDPSIQGIFSYGFLKEFNLKLGSAPGGMQRIILDEEGGQVSM